MSEHIAVRPALFLMASALRDKVSALVKRFPIYQ